MLGISIALITLMVIIMIPTNAGTYKRIFNILLHKPRKQPGIFITMTEKAPYSFGGYNYPAEPRQQVVALLELLPDKAEILDLGAGFGNNCLPLLERGHTVTATETNAECIGYLKQLTKDYPGRLRVVKAPVQALDTTHSYDAVINTMVLHFLQPDEAEAVIDTMKQVTRKGGFNVITSYLHDHTLPASYKWLLQKGKLRSYYQDWDIISYKESRPYNLAKIRTTRQLVRWCLGRRGYKAARLIAKRP